ncbi:hypothetical protein TSOC_007333 [Tetrabaena socialis]|uniref:t-SNARE coiled-coil homology domain-containing protein n=1 Tax=Tetrabaena socialis TaxID=47790 RepID=A0A2J8A1F2_9CHLO|nr:hypothetical protein TSOC_007333 [Tetrabaena socialis]|eukprot:PNH06343.1 hypothetical protein TSOC_007333 [Tetrabaena socialis]
MSGYRGAGLSARPGQAQEQVAISIDKFDFDSEVEGLRGHVKKIKQMSLAIEVEQKQQGELINSLVRHGHAGKLGSRAGPGGSGKDRMGPKLGPAGRMEREDTVERAKLMMRRAMGRLNLAYKRGGSNHMLLLVLFALCAFAVLYVLGKQVEGMFGLALRATGKEPQAPAGRLAAATEAGFSRGSWACPREQVYRIGRAVLGG